MVFFRAKWTVEEYGIFNLKENRAVLTTEVNGNVQTIYLGVCTIRVRFYRKTRRKQENSDRPYTEL